jgi:hypothetical protein
MSQTLHKREYIQGDFSSVVSGVRQSCFSLDSSLYTQDDGPPANKAQAWWKPKRRFDSIQETAPLDNYRASKENASRLWKRGSKTLPNSIADKELMEKVERKLKEKRLTAAMQAHEGRVLEDRRSNTHPAYRSSREVAVASKSGHASNHILTAMRPSSLTPLPRSAQRNCIGTSKLQLRSSSLSFNVSARSINRPYKPSPLQNVTRVTSMDVNKNLSPLPPERQIMLRHASKMD